MITWTNDYIKRLSMVRSNLCEAYEKAMYCRIRMQKWCLATLLNFNFRLVAPTRVWFVCLIATRRVLLLPYARCQTRDPAVASMTLTCHRRAVINNWQLRRTNLLSQIKQPFQQSTLLDENKKPKLSILFYFIFYINR